MRGARHHLSAVVQPHPGSRQAYGCEILPVSQAASRRNLYADFGPKVSAGVLKVLSDIGLRASSIENPTPPLEWVMDAISEKIWREAQANEARRSLNYHQKEPGCDRYPRPVACAVISATHRALGGSYRATADFLNDGIPRRDRSRGLSHANVWHACKTHEAIIDQHMKVVSGDRSDVESLRFVEDYDMRVLFRLYESSRQTDQYRNLRGRALAQALTSRADFDALIEKAELLERLSQQRPQARCS